MKYFYSSARQKGLHTSLPAMRLTAFFFALAVFFPAFAQAQYTPGGLGSTDLIGWFVADSLDTDGSGNVQTWYNQGSEGDATQADAAKRPALVTNVVNGKPVVRFSSAEEWLKSSSFSSPIAQPLTLGFHFNPAIDKTGVVFDASLSLDISDRFFFRILFTSGDGFDPAKNELQIFAGSGVTTDYTPSSFFSTINVFNQSASFIETSAFGSSNSNVGSSIATKIGIGAFIDSNDDTILRYEGDISELVFYSSGLNKTQRLILQNYFNTKYNEGNLTGSNLLFDPPTGFTNELIGIGWDDTIATAVSTTNSSSGGITISSTTSEFLDEQGRYLLTAHDGENAEYTTTDAPSSTRRSERTWYVQKTSNEDEITSDGDVEVSIDFSEVPGLAPDLNVSGASDKMYLVYNSAYDPSDPFPVGSNEIVPISDIDFDVTVTGSGPQANSVTITMDAIYIKDGYYTLFVQPYNPNEPDDPSNGDVTKIATSVTEIGAGSIELVGTYPGVSVEGDNTLVLVPGQGNLRVMNEFVVKNGAGLHIQPDAEFSTPGTARITLEPGARYLNEGDTDPILTMQLEIGSTGGSDEKGWRLFSLPFMLDENGSSLDISYADLLNFDGTDGFWTQGIPGSLSPNLGDGSVREFTGGSFQTPIADMNAAIPNGKGFSAYVYNCNEYTDTTVCADGVDPTTGTWPKTIEIEGREFRGTDFSVPSLGSGTFNLVGNPYPSAILWDEFRLANPNKSSTVYVYDPETAAYITYNGSSGDFDGVIAPFQSFWVDTNGSSSDIELPLNLRNIDSNYTFLKNDGATPQSEPQEELPPAIRLLASADDLSASMWLSFTKDGALDIDLFDAYQLAPLDRRPTMNVSSYAENGSMLDINVLPDDFDSVLEIPLNTDKLVPEDGSWVVEDAVTTIEWTELRNIPAGWTLEIRDNFTGEHIDMFTAGSYTFDTSESLKNRGQIRVPKEAFKFSYEFEDGSSSTSKAFDQDTRLSLIITPPNLNPNLHEAIVTGPNEGWRMISAPIDGVSYEDLLGNLWTQGFPGADEETGTPNVFWFDETDRDNPQTAGWNTPSSMQDFVGSSSQSVSAEQTAGKTILVYVFEDDRDGGTPGFPKRLRLEGAPFTNSLTQPLSFTPGEDDLAGFQLSGNPYKQALNWQSLLDDEANADAAFSESIYIWDANMGESGGYRVMNGSLLLGGLENEALPVLSSFQGFWVQATGEDAELRFNTAHTTEEDTSLFDGPDGQPELPQLSFT
ncbi:MAG: hypothetical protein ACOC2C_06450, partial [Cyclonatronaceae bacterium]